MYAKTAAALVAIAGQAQALNSHRHLHQVDRRGMETDWVTVWETVYVTEGEQAPPASTHFVANSAPVVHSTTAIVSSTPPPPPPAPTTTQAPTSQAAPPPPPAPKTTLATQVKPQPVNPLPISISLPIIGGQPSSTPQPTGSDGGNGGSGYTGAKRGIAYNDGILADLLGGQSQGRCGWAYNWGSNPNGLNSKLEFIPMLWGDKPEHTNNWHSDAQQAISNGAKTMFSFNEPDNAGQANMSPQAAAAAHAKYMSPYTGKVKIGAPSITNSGNPGEGISWLENFMSACTGDCHVDFCNVHWYSQSQYADTLFSHLEDAHKACGNKPIFLTEFAPLDKENANSFLKEVIPKLDSLDYLHGYSYFMAATGDLLSSNTLLSAVGNIYASL